MNNKLTIKGSGGQTIVSGDNLDRVFLTLSGNVAISNLVIEHGQALSDGALPGTGRRSLGPAARTSKLPTSVQFLDNVAVGQAGAAAVRGRMGPPAGPGGETNAEGGAIATQAAQLTLTIAFLAGTKRSAGPVR